MKLRSASGVLLLVVAACKGGDAASGAGAGGTGAGSTGTGAGGSGASGASGGGGNGASCDVIATFADGLAPTSELHVAPSGNDTTGDGSSAAPFASIEHAAGLATPGTAVQVHAGTYAGDGYVDGIAGTAAAPIWIGAAPGEARPILEGGGEGLHLSRARYLVLHDLEVRNMSANGVNCDDGGEVANPDASHHIVFRGLYIHDIGAGGNEDCLKLSGLNDYFVLDSELTVCGGSGSGSAIDHVGCHRGLIAHNSIHDLTGTGIQCKGGSEDIEIRHNRLIHAGERPVNMGGSTGFAYFRPPLDPNGANREARAIRVLGNVIVGGTSAVAFAGCVDCVLGANTIVDPDHWLFRILQETVSGGGYVFSPASAGVVTSNLFYFTRATLSGEDINVGAGTDPASFVLSNNLWYAHDAPSASAPQTPPGTETGAVVGADPGCAGAATGDYHIGPGSPAAGAGLSIAGLPADLDGDCYATPPSIGAYEVE